MNIIDIQKLCFEREKKILHNIDWQVAKGQRWAILGANGAGKTSLISTICAYNTPSSGEIKIDKDTYSESNWQEVRKHIALVGSQLRRQISQSELVIETVISGESATINYWGKPDKKLIQKAKRHLAMLKISNLALSKWGEISQGERQKVLIARALMLKPKVVFLDEPCTGLDPAALKNFLTFLDKLSENKSIGAIILCTHHIEEIPQSFTHALLLKDGQVFASGEIKKVLTSKNLSSIYKAKCVLRNRALKVL